MFFYTGNMLQNILRDKHHLHHGELLIQSIKEWPEKIIRFIIAKSRIGVIENDKIYHMIVIDKEYKSKHLSSLTGADIEKMGVELPNAVYYGEHINSRCISLPIIKNEIMHLIPLPGDDDREDLMLMNLPIRIFDFLEGITTFNQKELLMCLYLIALVHRTGKTNQTQKKIFLDKYVHFVSIDFVPYFTSYIEKPLDYDNIDPILRDLMDKIISKIY